MTKEFETTLLFIIKDRKVLLAEKKRGFGVGKVNGIGGKIEKGESVIDGLIRETREEVGVTPVEYEKVATINCDEYLKDGHAFETMHVFIARDYQGEICESDEMRPSWFSLDNIPYDRMFDGDRTWVPLVFKNKKFEAFIKFNKEFMLETYEIKEV